MTKLYRNENPEPSETLTFRELYTQEKYTLTGDEKGAVIQLIAALVLSVIVAGLIIYF